MGLPGQEPWTRRRLLSTVVALAGALSLTACSSAAAEVSRLFIPLGSRQATLGEPSGSPTPPAAHWQANLAGEPYRFGFGAGTHTPELVALYRSSSYLRLVPSETSAWGTSAVLLPTFVWVDRNGVQRYLQGGRVTVGVDDRGPDLVLTLEGRQSPATADWTLTTRLTLRVHPPAPGRIVADVTAQTVQDPPGAVVPLHRPGETFKPALLSSMNMGADQFDASAAYAGQVTVTPIPAEQWIFPTPVVTNVFGVRGGTSRWQCQTAGGKPAPRVELQLPSDYEVTGWVTRFTPPDPTQDNIAVWFNSADGVPASWSYRVVMTDETAGSCP
jgi:hypothetical protein